MKVLIIDASVAIGRFLAQHLRDKLNVAEIGESSSCEDAIRQIQLSAWDVVIVDMAVPGGGAIEVLWQLRVNQLRATVIVLSEDDSADVVRRCLELGAVGYVSRHAVLEEIVLAMHAVAAGQTYISLGVLEHMAGDPKPGETT